MIRILLFLFSLIIFTSCSPKYKIEKIYHPPTDKICLEKCSTDYQRCQNICQKNYSDCLEKSIERAERIYSQLKREYKIKMEEYYKNYDLYLQKSENYRKQLKALKDDYKFYERLCSQYKDKESCQKKDKVKKYIKQLEVNRPVPPEKPPEVGFSSVLESERKACSCDCGCKEIYDACYQSCGGKVEIKKICVEHCD